MFKNGFSGKYRISTLLVFLIILITTGCSPRKTITIYSLGYVRATSCSYEGEFLGGSGYDCVVRNFSDNPRDVWLECGSYDLEDRKIGSDDMTSIYNVTFEPGEERVARYYFDENAKTGVCSDVKNSIPSLKMAKSEYDEWYKNNIIEIRKFEF